jgi:acyl carrier protein
VTGDATAADPAGVDPAAADPGGAPPELPPAQELVAEALALVLDADPATVQPAALLAGELGADSLAVVELGIVIEQSALRRRLPLHLALGSLLPCETVGEVVLAVERALAAGEGLPDHHAAPGADPAPAAAVTPGGPPA